MHTQFQTHTFPSLNLPLETYIPCADEYQTILDAIQFAAESNASWTGFHGTLQQHAFLDDRLTQAIEVLRHCELVARCAYRYRLAGYLQRTADTIVYHGHDLARVTIALRDRGTHGHDLIVEFEAKSIDTGAQDTI